MSEQQHSALSDCVSTDCCDYRLQQFIWKRRCSALFNLSWKMSRKIGKYYEHLIYNGCRLCRCLDAYWLLFARPLLVVFGASKDALVYAYPYFMIYLIGTLPSMIATGMNPFINAQGYSTIGMTSIAVGAIANLLLDPLFILLWALVCRVPRLQL